MSDVSLINDFDQFVVEKMPEKKSDEKFFKYIKIFFGVMLSLFVVEIFLYKFVRPSVSDPRIVFKGLNHYSEKQLLDIIAPVYHGTYFSFDTVQAASRLSAVSGIESVSIEKHYPDRISINIVERESVAMTFVTEGSRTIPIQIDKNAVLFEVSDAEAIDFKSIPIISGIPVEHLSGGMRIPSKYRVLIEQIANIRSIGQDYFAAVSEICVIPKKTGNYELMIIPVDSKARVLTDRSLNEEALQRMMVVLEVVKSIAPDVEEIDLRYGSISYRAGVDGGNLE